MKLLPSLLRSAFHGVFDPRSSRQRSAFLLRFGVAPNLRPAHGGHATVLACYAARPDLREAFPLGLTPHQREGFATWLMEHGRADVGITDAEIVDHLLTAAADPAHGLRETWLLSPDWQRLHPEPFTKPGWRKFRSALAEHYRIEAPWLKRARRPHLPPPAKWGVNLLAHFRYPSGLQEEAEQYAHAIRAHGGGVSLRDAPIGFRRADPNVDWLGPEMYDITLAKLGACESFDAQYPLTGWHPRPGVYRIAALSWELESLPRSLAGACNLADEIWTPSEFCARALRQTFPEKHVTAMLPAVSLPRFAPLSRSDFGLPMDRFLFFFSFDMGSVMERKNPLGLIEAYRRAFRGDARVHLAIKVTRGDSRPADLARLQAAARHAGATLIDRVLPRGEVVALMNSCDAYVSLHRAEGFGYTIVEAMLLGKPVIATGYSANCEFMTAETADAVDHHRVPVGDGHAPYPASAFWAEPNLDHAAALMRKVFEQPNQAKAKGRRAQKHLSQLLSPSAVGRRIVSRLTAICQERSYHVQ